MTSEEIEIFISNRAMKDIETQESTLDELGLDSLDKLEIVYDLSDRTRIPVEEAKTNQFKTVKDVVDYFKEK